MSEQRLVNLLESQFNESDTSVFEVGEQRERNHRYYTLQNLGNEVDGKSHYISPDVFDTVNAKKSYFSEVFLSGRETVRFKPTKDGDQDEAKKRTAYVNHQLDLNQQYDLLRDAWHDAFVAKRCVVLAEWHHDEQEYEQQVTLMPVQQAAMLFDDPKIIDVDTSQIKQSPGQQGMMVEGTVTIIKDASQCRLTLVQPERYFRDPNVTYIIDCAFAGYEEDITRAELVERGYDPTVVQSLRVDYRFRREEEDNSRKAHDRSWTRRQLHQRPKELEEVTLYKTWTWLDMSTYFGEGSDRGSPMMSPGVRGSPNDRTSGPNVRSQNRNYGEINPGALKLWEIHWSQGEILSYTDGELAVTEATEIPFFEWCEHKISHAEHGLADADVVSHTQKTQSVLKRLIIDNQQQRNTSRYEAVQGAIKNPRELLDNPIGGVVWTRAIGSVAPLATPELSPLTMQVVEMLDQDKEERSGVSRLSQGLNTDVVRYQNAGDMIERLTNNANRRLLSACRDFALTWLIPLSQYIYRLGARNDTNVHQVEVGGQWLEIQPSGWPDIEMPMKVASALTPEEGQMHAQVLMMMHAQLMADPGMQVLYGLPQKHAIFDDAFEALGVADTSQYMKRPDSQEVMQALQMQQQMQQKMMEMQMDQQQFQKWLMESNDGREWYLAQLQGMKLQVDAADKATDNVRADDEFAWKREMDTEELKLEKTQNRPVAVS